MRDAIGHRVATIAGLNHVPVDAEVVQRICQTSCLQPVIEDSPPPLSCLPIENEYGTAVDEERAVPVVHVLVPAWPAGPQREFLGGQSQRLLNQRPREAHDAGTLVHVRPGIYVMYDDLAAPKPATFQWLLHTYDKININGQHLIARRGKALMDVDLLLPNDAAISQNNKYEPEPEEQKLRKLNWKP